MRLGILVGERHIAHLNTAMPLIERVLHRLFSPQTVRAIQFDRMRAATRRRIKRQPLPSPLPEHLHLGCGPRLIEGWLNVDITGSNFDLDLGDGNLPFPDSSFTAILSQHTIEHLHLTEELLPLLRECERVLQPGGQLWLSCPDIRKICVSYLDHNCEDLIDARQKRHSGWKQGSGWTLDKETKLENTPGSHFVNSVFFQAGEHRNLFDFELLRWLLDVAGFPAAERASEGELMSRFDGVPSRGDEEQTLYVRATKSSVK
ncbi:class I SAM-dependent methyltransferase [Roseiconus lacunae]|uniref:class I SAM-dependent methyltransferase n=1 Tax=Roseiconus lacunae TaxID=2605694 RepID=UPI0011F10F0A|nr:methyltransferase domain-containing protein [Roseiconus lacunae]